MSRIKLNGPSNVEFMTNDGSFQIKITYKGSLYAFVWYPTSETITLFKGDTPQWSNT